MWNGPPIAVNRQATGAFFPLHRVGGILKWPTRADCKSAGLRLRRFESFSHHHSSPHGRPHLSCPACGRTSLAALTRIHSCFLTVPGDISLQQPKATQRYEENMNEPRRAGQQSRCLLGYRWVGCNVPCPSNHKSRPGRRRLRLVEKNCVRQLHSDGCRHCRHRCQLWNSSARRWQVLPARRRPGGDGAPYGLP